MKTYFTKTFTRDNCIIIQEIWDKGYHQDYLWNENPYWPTQINYLIDGVVEIWDNVVAVQWFEDQIQEMHKKDTSIFYSAMKQYERIAKQVKHFRKKDRFDSIEELKLFIELLQNGTAGFLFFYHSGKDKRSPEDIQECAQKLRDMDSFYDDADRLIKRTIEHVYPYTQGLAISVRINELENIPDKQELEQRFQYCVHTCEKGIEKRTIEDYLSEHSHIKFEKYDVPDGGILKGQVSYPGKAKGRVRILKLKKDIQNFEEGAILVSPMTTPDFLPAMKKAAAIVTDEGGILCHAAIVARESQKPCVIGTKVATKMFMDGDVVEVDADNGTIRRV